MIARIYTQLLDQLNRISETERVLANFNSGLLSFQTNLAVMHEKISARITAVEKRLDELEKLAAHSGEKVNQTSNENPPRHDA